MPSIRIRRVAAELLIRQMSHEESILQESIGMRLDESVVVGESSAFVRGDGAGAAASAFNDARWQTIDLPHEFRVLLRLTN